MVKVKLLKRVGDDKRGSVLDVENNIAHTLIDKGYAKLFKEEVKAVEKAPKDKMVKRTNKKVRRK